MDAVSKSNQTHNALEFCNVLGSVAAVLFACVHSTAMTQHVSVQGKRHALGPKHWAMSVCILLAKAQVGNPNRTCYNHISSLPTKSTWCDSTAVHAQYCLLHVRVQTNWALLQNKKYQTCLD